MMARENDELQALVVVDPEHRDQAALLLLYAISPSEEDLLAIVLHVPFLREHAAERLLATTPKEETLWQLESHVPTLREQAEKMLFVHYPSHANLVKLLHPTWGVWNAEAAELLLADNPSDAELQAIICTFNKFTESPWRECRQKAAQMLAARI